MLLMDAKTYGTETVAKKIGVTRQTLHDWIRSGHIPAPKSVDLGPRSILLWSTADIERAQKLKGTLPKGPKKRPRTKK